MRTCDKQVFTYLFILLLEFTPDYKTADRQLLELVVYWDFFYKYFVFWIVIKLYILNGTSTWIFTVTKCSFCKFGSIFRFVAIINKIWLTARVIYTADVAVVTNAPATTVYTWKRGAVAIWCSVVYTSWKKKEKYKREVLK